MDSRLTPAFASELSYLVDQLAQLEKQLQQSGNLPVQQSPQTNQPSQSQPQSQPQSTEPSNYGYNAAGYGSDQYANPVEPTGASQYQQGGSLSSGASSSESGSTVGNGQTITLPDGQTATQTYYDDFSNGIDPSKYRVENGQNPVVNNEMQRYTSNSVTTGPNGGVQINVSKNADGSIDSGKMTLTDPKLKEGDVMVVNGFRMSNNPSLWPAWWAEGLQNGQYDASQVRERDFLEGQNGQITSTAHYLDANGNHQWTTQQTPDQDLSQGDHQLMMQVKDGHFLVYVDGELQRDLPPMPNQNGDLGWDTHFDVAVPPGTNPADVPTGTAMQFQSVAVYHTN